MVILGLDIGYSNLKFVYGNGENEKKEVVLPAGAGHITSLPISLTGENINEGVEVKINNELWVGGIAHENFNNIFRELLADYPFTNTYKALLKTALASTGASNIDLLVTGLPINQFKDKDTVEKLKNLLEGVHYINDGKEVIVRKATVVPQPTGGYASLIQESNEEMLASITTGITVSIDPGFFSVDWVVLNNGNIRSDLSDTSLQAVSVILEKTSEIIQKETGIKPTVDQLEEIIRRGKNEFFFGSKIIDITPYLEKASLKVSKLAMRRMVEGFRNEDKAVSSIILCGGGSHFYKEIVEQLFPNASIFVSDTPVLANANGFYYIGCSNIRRKES